MNAAYFSGGMPVACVIASTSSISAAAAANAPAMHVERRQEVGHDREQAERAGLARDAHAAGRELVPELVVPEILREPARQPQPVPVGPPPSGSANARSARESGATRRRVPVREARHEGVEERVGRARAGTPLRRARRLGHRALVRAVPRRPANIAEAIASR